MLTIHPLSPAQWTGNVRQYYPGIYLQYRIGIFPESLSLFVFCQVFGLVVYYTKGYDMNAGDLVDGAGRGWTMKSHG